MHGGECLHMIYTKHIVIGICPPEAGEYSGRMYFTHPFKYHIDAKVQITQQHLCTNITHHATHDSVSQSSIFMNASTIEVNHL